MGRSIRRLSLARPFYKTEAMNLSALLRIAVICYFVVIPVRSNAGVQKSSAGWAQVEITPPLGIALGGRGGNYVLARQVIDPLYAQVTYLTDQNGRGMVFISFDLVGLTHDLSDRLRLLAVQELGVDWNLVILNCSHTHSGPNMLRDILAGVDAAPPIEIEYFNVLKEKTVAALREARKNLKPIQADVFEGTSQMAINRRGKNKQGQRAIIPDPSGPIDDKVWVLRLTPQDGSASAFVFSYACHPVIVYGYAGAAISADFPGMTRTALHEKLGEKAHIQYLQGLAGNVRPRALADLKANGFRGGSPEKLKEAGNELASGVLKALESKGNQLQLDFAGVSNRPLILRGEPPPREVYEKMAKDEKSEHLRRVGEHWLKRYDTGEGFAKGDPRPVGVIRLASNQWIVYLGGEPVVEWRDKITKWLGSRKVVAIGYAPEANTYLPTESLLPEGGYEVLECNRTRVSSPAAFAPGMEEVIRQSLLRQLAFIEAGEK
jgi:neutral ceramidase